MRASQASEPASRPAVASYAAPGAMAAMAMSYCRGMRCTNDQSRLALSTSPEDQSLYASVANRTLEAEGIGPMDKIKDYTLVECFRTTAEGRRELLLGLKKRGLGAGKFNGFGGKFDVGETAVECARASKCPDLA